MSTADIRALAESWTEPGWQCDRDGLDERIATLARALLAYLPVVEAAEAWADSDGCDDLNDPAATALGAAVNALRAGGES